jgi:tetratricopeptide (TPR) repeat protein
MTLLFLGLAVFACPEAEADLIALHDGRVFEGKVEDCGDVIKLHLQHGTVSIPAVQVKSVLAEGDADLGYKAKKERERIAKAIEEMRAHREWRNRYQEETRHFAFNYNVTPEIAKEYADLLEGFYKDFAKKLGAKLGQGEKRKKMEINLFRDKENFDQVGGIPMAAGFWNFVDERLFFYHDRNDLEYVRSVLLHEFTHLLTHLIDPRFNHPIWVEEGTAEYFGATVVEDGKLKFGGMQEGRLVSMARWREKGNDYHLEELMRCPRGAFGGIEYGWAWSFVHFMMENKKYTKKFMRYYTGLATDTSVDRERFGKRSTVTESVGVAYFKKIFKLRNLDKLNDEWHDYIDTQLKVSSGRGYLYEARSHFWSGKNEDALESIQNAEENWEGDPSPLLYYYKGRILNNLARYPDARKALLEAIALDPLNAWNYYYLGDVVDSIGGDAEEKEAVRLKKLALEIEPEDYTLRYRVEREVKDQPITGGTGG